MSENSIQDESVHFEVVDDVPIPEGGTTRHVYPWADMKKKGSSFFIPNKTASQLGGASKNAPFPIKRRTVVERDPRTGETVKGTRIWRMTDPEEGSGGE